MVNTDAADDTAAGLATHTTHPPVDVETDMLDRYTADISHAVFVLRGNGTSCEWEDVHENAVLHESHIVDEDRPTSPKHCTVFHLCGWQHTAAGFPLLQNMPFLFPPFLNNTLCLIPSNSVVC